MSKSAIICVDDEKVVLSSLGTALEKEFGKDYIVELADNAEDALAIYFEFTRMGYDVPVIISDYIMPGMKGDELLKVLHEQNSRIFKILLTGQADIQGIANAVNQASLFRILFKPWDNNELVFTVKEAIKHFLKNELISKQFYKIKKFEELNESLRQTSLKLKQVNEENNKIFSFVLPALVGLNTVYEKGYYNGHTKFISALSLRMAKELNFEVSMHIEIIALCLLYHIITQKMPEEYVGADPNTMEKKEKDSYFNKFFNEIDILSADEHLNRYAILLSHLWEHFDGSGLPHGINYTNLSQTTQIVNLAITYHNSVYRIPDDSLAILEEEGEISQYPEVTSQRHGKAMIYLIKNSSWYDIEIIEAFKKLVKTKSYKDVMLDKDIIKVYKQGDSYYIDKLPINDYLQKKEVKITIPFDKILKEMHESEQSLAKSKRSLETNMSVSDLRSGMITGIDVLTKFGRLMIPKNTMLSDDHIEEIRHALSNGLISDETGIKVFIPREA